MSTCGMVVGGWPCLCPYPAGSLHPRRGLLVPDSKAPLLTTNLDFSASIRVWEQALCMWPHSPSQAASIKVTSVCEWLRRVTAAGPAHTCHTPQGPPRFREQVPRQTPVAGHHGFLSVRTAPACSWVFLTLGIHLLELPVWVSGACCPCHTVPSACRRLAARTLLCTWAAGDHHGSQADRETVRLQEAALTALPAPGPEAQSLLASRSQETLWEWGGRSASEEQQEPGGVGG